MQSSLDQAIERRRSSPVQCPNDRFDGRGIVICAGGTRYFTCAWVLISILRRVHRNALPIQVWHLGRREMSEEMRILLGEEGVEVVDAETVAARHPARLAGGWPLKPYAIAQSRFREVLYLDADTVPLVDPQTAFDWCEYQDHGLLLWPDLVDIRASNPIWTRLGISPTDRASIDSGVLLVDKARAWDILELAVVMNEHCEEIYDLIYGDKDTLMLSAQLLNRSFGLVPHRPFSFEWDMVQRDAFGEPFLHHRTGAKWLLNAPNRPLAAPALMPSCEAALADLRQRWSGSVFHAPARSAQARAAEQRLVGLGTVHFETTAADTRELELLPGGRVGAGRELEQHWAVVDGAGPLLLQFYHDGVPIATLEQRAHGCWHGSSTEPGYEILLRERAHAGASGGGGNDRVPRSAAEVVAALLQPAWFATGYDAACAAELGSALKLLNDAFDDVPELIAMQVERQPISLRWRSFLDQLASRLESRRDQRLANVRRATAARSPMPGPAHYARPA